MKVGLALGGGGARGFAHFGVIKELQKAGIDCSIVTGTSAGALVGAAYAAGKVEEMLAMALNLKLSDIPLLLSPSWSKTGFFSGKNALENVAEIVKAKNIEDLPKRFAAVAVDLVGGNTVVFDKGNLQSAIRASISIPVVFTPVLDNGMILVDGGTLEPLPVQTARDLGADFVIAVDLFGGVAQNEEVDAIWERERQERNKKDSESALRYLRTISDKLSLGEWLDRQGRNRTENPNLLDVLESTLEVSQRALTSVRLKEHPADYVIRPSLSRVGFLDFHRGKPVVEIGELATKECMDSLLKTLQNFGKF